ncbi:MAG: hypothetical protein L0Z62_14875 [Gemmataceae bacterium]|nr:hypothetical protein [Gemmataceae bacterium]
MARRLFTLGSLPILLLLCTRVSVWADFIAWSYAWSRSPLVIAADGDGTGGISLATATDGQALGNSAIGAVVLTTFSSAAGTIDLFTDKAYNLTLELTDQLSGASGSLTFHGLFNGTLTATAANISNTFTGATTQTLTLGDNVYTVAIGPYSPPGPPGDGSSGAIGAHVSVSGQPTEPPVQDPPGPAGGPPVQDTPEPAGLILAGLGFGFLGLGCYWRARRTQRIAAGAS